MSKKYLFGFHLEGDFCHTWNGVVWVFPWETPLSSYQSVSDATSVAMAPFVSLSTACLSFSGCCYDDFVTAFTPSSLLCSRSVEPFLLLCRCDHFQADDTHCEFISWLLDTFLFHSYKYPCVLFWEAVELLGSSLTHPSLAFKVS
jgi:hypothetical protein